MIDKKSDLIIDSQYEESDLGVGLEALHETRLHTVTAQQEDARLDRVLALAVPEFSRSYLQQLIEQSFVSVNGVVICKSSKHLRPGDELAVQLRPTEQSQAYVPEAIAVDVMFEDAYLLIVNKPAGLVVHPAPGNWRGTLLNGLLMRYPEARHLPRAGIVHRLDKDTSGLMVVAKTRLCMDALTKMISDRDVAREYLAIAHGAWRSFADREGSSQGDGFEGGGAPDRIVTQSIGRDSKNRLKMAAYDPKGGHGRLARTDIYVLNQLDDFTVVQCKLHTGRTHQIRVHMAYLGHPLVADSTYGGKSALGLSRQALHAKRLAFVHPMTGADMEFLSPIPLDLSAALKQFAYEYN